ncbi:MAG: hypothetical protein KDA05_00015 [Phycisphaerales bacterium]|nr:hypothetical protein [Phycisphaerales bacterium]
MKLIVRVVTAGLLLASAWNVAPALAQPEPYLRVTESDDGSTMRLDVASRMFEPIDGIGPRIVLVGAAHVGDSVFYRRLQYLLDAQDVVLFEGVGLGDPTEGLPVVGRAERADRTERRARLLVAAIVGHRARTGRYPADLDELYAGMELGTAEMVRPLMQDADAHPFEYELLFDAGDAPTSFVVRAGDREFDRADLARPSGEPLDSMAGDEGIQRGLARALGVEFQLDAVDYSQNNWVNCDVTLEELERLLAEAGLAGEGDSFLAMMSGSGLMGALQGTVLGLISSSPTMREMVKMVMIDVLGQAEQFMSDMPGPMGDLMDVLLHERNDVVEARLHEIVDDAGEFGSVGVFYGAAHLPGIEDALVQRMGYRPVATHWITAMGVDLNRVGASPAQARQIRQMIRRTMEQEFSRMRDAAPPAREPAQTTPRQRSKRAA